MIRNIAAYVIAWLISAAVLTLIFASLIDLCGIDLRSLGFFSSGVSFAAAFVAGMTLHGKPIRCVITGAVFSLILVLIGWMIKGSIAQMRGIVSVIPFTITGTALGGLIMSGRNKKVYGVDIKNNIKIK